MILAERIRGLRLEKGLTQQKLADAIGVSQKCVNFWEKGTNEPRSGFIVLLAEFFGVSCDYLLGKSEY